MQIPIDYVQTHRIEHTVVDDFKQQYYYPFKTREEALVFIRANGGVLIHGTFAQSKSEEWQVWPTEIKGRVLTAVDYEQD